jgi:putative oxidoreductase
MPGIIRTFAASTQQLLADTGLLIARLGFGGLMLTHGAPKLQKVLAALTNEPGEKDILNSFPDPIGIGSTLSALLATAAEFFGAALLMLGLATRFNAAALAFTMFVAAIIHHANDPFQDKELALLFMVGYVVLILTGPGRFSVDRLITSKWAS